MSTTAFDATQADQLIASIETTRNNVTEQANITRQTIAQLTTEGLQGSAAEASDALSAEVQTTLNNVDAILQRYQTEVANYGDNMGSHDASFAGRIGGA